MALIPSSKIKSEAKGGKPSEAIRLARVHYVQCKADIKQAKTFLKNNEAEKCILMSVQAAMNCLSSVCLSDQRIQNPCYNLSDMLKICIGLSAEFESLKPECDALDAIQDFKLFKHHVRGGKNINPETMRGFFDNARRIISVSTRIIRRQKLFKIPISSFFT